MIVMPQLNQHEILFRAHDAIGHQGISKVVARIQDLAWNPSHRCGLRQSVPDLPTGSRQTWRCPFPPQEHSERVV